MIDETQTRAVQLAELTDAPQPGSAVFGENLDLIRDVKVSIRACIGQCELTVRELFALKSSEVLTLDRDSDGPVDLYLDGRLVGRGELVVVGEHFGVRILEMGPANADRKA